MLKLAQFLISSKSLATVVLAIVFLSFCMGQSLSALDQISIGLGESGVGPADTVWVGQNYEFQISLENDNMLGGFQLGLEISSPDGAEWAWVTKPGGYGPDGLETGGQYATVVSGSRMDPPADIWDLTDFIVAEKNTDGISPDTLFPGGVAYLNGLPAGALEHMFSLHFMATQAGAAGTVGTLCIDSAFIPPVGNMIFADAASGQAIVPEINTPLCFPVAAVCPFDSDGDGFGDPGHPENLCPDDNCPTIPNADQADDDGDGVGNVCDQCPGFDDTADADGDGVADGCDVCPGFDDTADADGDGVPDGCDMCPGFDDTVDSDGDGFADGCDACPGFDDTVDSDGDSVADGCDICAGFDDAADADNDGVPDGCDVCPGFDDTVDSDGDSVPDGCDICAGFDDGVDSDADGVPDGCDICPGYNDSEDGDGDTVPDGCDNCPSVANTDQADSDENGVGDACDYICGDANGDESINIGDAVFMITYIFNGGPAPDPIESGDANCDNDMNIGDAVYLINHIFNGGPDPCADCE